MLSLVCKKLNLCPVMPASRGVNPLVTSHTLQHLSSICLQSRSHDKPILYFISHCLNKIDIAWNPRKKKEKKIIIKKKLCLTKIYSLHALSWICNIKRCKLKTYAAPSSGSKRQLSYTVLGPCYYIHKEFGSDLIS